MKKFVERDVLYRKSCGTNIFPKKTCVERIEKVGNSVFRWKILWNPFFFFKKLWNVTFCTENPGEQINFQGNVCGTYRKSYGIRFVEPNISIKNVVECDIVCRKWGGEHINFQGNLCGTYIFPKKPAWNIKKVIENSVFRRKIGGT